MPTAIATETGSDNPRLVLVGSKFRILAVTGSQRSGRSHQPVWSGFTPEGRQVGSLVRPDGNDWKLAEPAPHDGTLMSVAPVKLSVHPTLRVKSTQKLHPVPVTHVQPLVVQHFDDTDTVCTDDTFLLMAAAARQLTPSGVTNTITWGKAWNSVVCAPYMDGRLVTHADFARALRKAGWTQVANTNLWHRR